MKSIFFFKIAIILLNILSTICTGQNLDTTFYHIGENEGINKLIFKDSVFTSLSSTMVNGIYNTITLTDIHSSGEILKHKNFKQSSNHFSGWDMIRDYDNNIVIVGSYEINKDSLIPFVLKLTQNFDSLWIRFFNDPKVELEEGYNIQLTPDSNYLCLISKATFNKSQKISLLKLDRNGNKLWEKQYNFGNEAFQDPQALYVYKSGDILLGWFNYLTKNGIPYHQAKITKLNEKGEIKWTKIIDGKDYSVYSILKISGLEDEGCVTAWVDDSLDNMAISRYDIEGNKLWKTTFPDNPITFPDKYIMWYQFSEMGICHDGNIMVSGYVRSKDFWDEIFVMKLNVNSGQLLWRKIYKADKFNTYIEYPRSLVSTPDGRIALGTYRADETDENVNSQNWLLVMDRLGCIVPNCEDSLINVQKTGVANKDLSKIREIFFVVNPNPIVNNINCYFFNPIETQFASILLFNESGEKILERKISIDKQFLQIEVNQLPPGTYILQYIREGHLVQSEKVVIMQ